MKKFIVLLGVIAIVAAEFFLFHCSGSSEKVGGEKSSSKLDGPGADLSDGGGKGSGDRESAEGEPDFSSVRQTEVTRREFTFIDKSRKTPATAKTDEKPERELRVIVWTGPITPQEAYSHPLLVMAHGLGGLPEKFDQFARKLAAEKIAVAAVQFPLTNQNSPSTPAGGFLDLKSQPGDLSFCLTKLLEKVRNPASSLFARFSPDKVAVLGHSLGGGTVLGLTRYDCCRDSRFKAVIAVAPFTVLKKFFNAPEPSPSGPPILIAHGTDDKVIPSANSKKLYQKLKAPKYFVEVKGSGHSELLESPKHPSLSVMAELTAAFVKKYLNQESQALQKLLARLKGEGYFVQYLE